MPERSAEYLARQSAAGKARALQMWGTATREERFWAKVDKNGPTIREELGSCWIWLARCRNGYGIFHDGQHQVTAHRFGWELTNGPIPDRLKLLHDCDNPSCVRPAHLHVGTQLDNCREREERDRGNHARGERVHTAKLTAESVLEIRRLYATGMVQTELAKRFGVAQTSISHIVRRDWWQQVG